MKKYNLTILFSFLLFSLSAQIADSTKKSHTIQRRWSIDFAAGYGLPIAGSIIGQEDYNDDIINTATYKQVIGTFGGGAWSFLDADYLVTPAFGIFAGTYFFQGADKRTEYTEDVKVADQIKWQTKIAIRSIGADAGFFFSDTLFHCVVKAQSGFMTGMENQAIINWHNESSNSTAQTSSDKQTREFGGLSYGWVNRFGINKMLNRKLQIGIEGFVLLNSWGPKKGHVNSYSIDGVNSLYTLHDYEIDYKLVSKMTYIATQPALNGGIQFKTVYPMHAAGILLHVNYRF